MRLTTINVEKFQHDGLVVDKGWTQFHYAKAEPKAQSAFREHVGRFVRIHPDDVGDLAKLGLALDGARIVEAKPELKSESGDASAKGKIDGGIAATTAGGTGNGKGKPDDVGAKAKDAK